MSKRQAERRLTRLEGQAQSFLPNLKPEPPVWNAEEFVKEFREPFRRPWPKLWFNNEGLIVFSGDPSSTGPYYKEWSKPRNEDYRQELQEIVDDLNPIIKECNCLFFMTEKEIHLAIAYLDEGRFVMDDWTPQRIRWVNYPTDIRHGYLADALFTALEMASAQSIISYPDSFEATRQILVNALDEFRDAINFWKLADVE